MISDYARGLLVQELNKLKSEIEINKTWRETHEEEIDKLNEYISDNEKRIAGIEKDLKEN